MLLVASSFTTIAGPVTVMSHCCSSSWCWRCCSSGPQDWRGESMSSWEAREGAREQPGRDREPGLKMFVLYLDSRVR